MNVARNIIALIAMADTQVANMANTTVAKMTRTMRSPRAREGERMGNSIVWSDTTMDNKYTVSRDFHDGAYTNKWCVWNPSNVFFCACENRKDALIIADLLNQSTATPLPLFASAGK